MRKTSQRSRAVKNRCVQRTIENMYMYSGMYRENASRGRGLLKSVKCVAILLQVSISIPSHSSTTVYIFIPELNQAVAMPTGFL